MLMAQLESFEAGSTSELPAPPSSTPPSRVLPRGITLAAIVVVSLFLQAEARNLWRECVMLQDEVRESQQHAVVGYLNIAPIATCAEPPANWYRNEGKQALLWSGWQQGAGHRWFRFQQGELDPARFYRPTSLIISRPIDFPLVESRGGQIWRRIPSEALVVGHTLRGVKCVYPSLVLGKVQVINDIVGGHPFLVMVNLLATEQEAFSVFDAAQDGHRLTMATTGYFRDGKPLLVDRGTESLWLEEKDALRAIAGKLKNTPLPRIARLAPVTWSSWLARNPDSRLLVGADRSNAIPNE